MDLHPGEIVVFEGHPSWRGVLSFYIKGLLVALVIAALVLLIVTTAAGVLVFVGLAAIVILTGFFKRMATHYVITTDRLRIRRGVLRKAVQQTSIDRVQNVNTEQSIVDCLLRVGKVDFDTAGTDDSDFTFVAVSRPDAVVTAVDKARRRHDAPGQSL